MGKRTILTAISKNTGHEKKFAKKKKKEILKVHIYMEFAYLCTRTRDFRTMPPRPMTKASDFGP